MKTKSQTRKYDFTLIIMLGLFEFGLLLGYLAQFWHTLKESALFIVVMCFLINLLIMRILRLENKEI